MRRPWWLLVVAGLAPACVPAKPPIIIPTPEPTPTPETGMQPLRAEGAKFVPPILGSVTTHHNWPLVDTAGLDAIAAAGLNYTAMRLPLFSDDRGPAYELYERATGASVGIAPLGAHDVPAGDARLRHLVKEPGRAAGISGIAGVAAESAPPAPAITFDLSRFSPAFDANLAGIVAYAEKKGIYVNLGLWDGWGCVHNELPLFWHAGVNVNGVDLGRCSDFSAPPTATHVDLVRHVVGIVGRFPNVVFELGNEANRCRPSAAFIDGIRQAVRAAEAEGHYPKHLWSPGTVEGNGELGGEYDFVSYHDSAPPPTTAPVEVNEFSPETRGTYLSKFGGDRARGIVRHYWHDDPPASSGLDWEAPAWEAEWIGVMAVMTKPVVVTGCTDIPDQDAVARPRWVAPKYATQVNAALDKVNGAGVVEVAGPLHPFLENVAQALREQGLCAGVQADSEGPVDELCVGTSQECQGQHVFVCAPGTCAHGSVARAVEHQVCDPNLGEEKCPRPYGPLRDTWVRP